MLDFEDFDRKFELKASEASEDLIAKKEQGGSVEAQYARRGLSYKTETLFSVWSLLIDID